MNPHLLTISQQEDDIRLAKFIALTNAYSFHESTDPKEVARHLTSYPEVLVLWDGDAMKAGSEMVTLLSKHVRPSRNFAITNDSVGAYPHLMKYPFFGHHIQRRYMDPAPTFFAKMVRASLHAKAEGLKPYFDPETKTQKIEIKQSAHKSVAIEALQKTLTNRGVRGRIATLVAQCADELLLNALFDAPMTNERLRFRHRYSRAMEFELTPNERVVMEMAASDQYMGLCISDTYGSLNKIQVFNSLRAYFQKEARTGDALSAPASGFGLHGIIQSGVNLKIHCQIGKKTEVMMFFPIVSNYKDFRTSFRFFSLLVGE